MPNWCSNELIINGPDAEEIINNLGSKEFPVLDFNKIIPMPKHQTDLNKPNPFFAEGAIGNEQKEKFGSSNWHDWRINHWGTKWNASDAVKEPEENKIMFETAWSPPDQIAQALSEQYTNHEIIIKYDEPGMGFSGTMVYKDGRFLDKKSRFSRCLDPLY